MTAYLHRDHNLSMAPDGLVYTVEEELTLYTHYNGFIVFIANDNSCLILLCVVAT
jgi:hypothetical protein